MDVDLTPLRGPEELTDVTPLQDPNYSAVTLGLDRLEVAQSVSLGCFFDLLGSCFCRVSSLLPRWAEEQGPGSAFCHRFLVWCRYAGARHQQPSESPSGRQLTAYGGVVLHRLPWLWG